VDTFEEEAEIDLVAVRTERVELKNELNMLEAEMEGYLKELGYDVNGFTSATNAARDDAVSTKE